MRRFRFEYERLLRLKRQTVKQMEIRAKQIEGVIQTRRTDYSNQYARLTDIAEQMALLAETNRPMPIVSPLHGQIGIQVALDKIRKEIDSLEMARTSLLKRIRLLSAETDALDSLKQQQLRQHRSEAARSVERQQDELAALKWFDANVNEA